MRTHRVLPLVCLLAAAIPIPLRAADGALGAEAARQLPIADVHFHVMPWMNVQEVAGYMDKHNIRWAGGAAALGGPERNAEAGRALGSRYIVTTGQGQWLALKRTGGVAALEDADSPAFKQALESMEKFLSGSAKGIGEIHVNTTSTAANQTVLHKIRADAPTLKAMLALAGRHGKPVNIHAQWDSDTAKQVEALADSSPQALLILSHCGSLSSAGDMREVLQRHANVMCDLSYRSPPQLSSRRAGYAVFDRGGVRSAWRNLIEEFPDRFMVGLDDQESWAHYEETAGYIRAMLAELTPATAEKVAYKNAVRVFKLE